MKKALYTILIATCVLVTFVGCGKSSEMGKTSPNSISNVSDDMINGQMEEADDADALTEDDADALMEGCLKDTGCEAEYQYRIDDERGSFFIYYITKGEDDLEQMLAVNAVSGEISVYNDLDDKFSEFESFSEYKEENDENISWIGVYGKDKYELIVDQEEPGSLVFSIFEGDKVLTGGYVYMENNIKAVGKVEDDEYTLEIKDDVITVTVSDKKSPYNGQYTMK